MPATPDSDPMAQWQAELWGHGPYPNADELLGIHGEQGSSYFGEDVSPIQVGQSSSLATKMTPDHQPRSPDNQGPNMTSCEQVEGTEFGTAAASLYIPNTTTPWSPENLQYQDPPPQSQKAQNSLACEFCSRISRSPSDASKHLNTHIRPFICTEQDCPSVRGFASKHDLERHKKSVHNLIPTAGSRKWYICPIGGGEGCLKMWPRLDNCKAHMERKHRGSAAVAPLVVDPDEA